MTVVRTEDRGGGDEQNEATEGGGGEEKESHEFRGEGKAGQNRGTGRKCVIIPASSSVLSTRYPGTSNFPYSSSSCWKGRRRNEKHGVILSLPSPK